MTDLISDMLIRLKNGYISRKPYIIISYSNNVIRILDLLCIEGFINSYFYLKNGNILVKLKYYRNDFIFKGYRRISKPGSRKYYGVSALKRFFFYEPFVLVSTIKGFMHHRLAISKNLGGEVLFVLSYC